MTNESAIKRYDLINSRFPEFDALCSGILQSMKEDSTRSVHLKPSTSYQDIYNALAQYFGYEGVSYLDTDRKTHGQDVGINQMAIPDIVVYPRKVEQIQWLVSFANQHRIPLIPYGSGSSLQSNALAIQGGITIDMGKMAAVLEFNPDDREIKVQCGMAKNTLTDYLRGSNLFFPIDIGCDATIGGLIATNASGSGSHYYGPMRAQVLSLKVVMPDGNIVVTGNRAKKHSIGYDLNSLFIGAEGTLGIVYEAVLKLQPLPKCFAAAYATFENLLDATNVGVKLFRQGINVSRCELLDKQTIEAINKFHGTAFLEKNYIFVEVHGNSRAAVDFIIDDCKDVCREGGVEEFQQFSDESGEIPMIWKARSTAWMSIAKCGLNIQLAVVDVAVPLSRLNEALQFAFKDIEMLGIKFAPVICHLGDGSFYIIIPVHYHDRSAINQIEILCSRIGQRAIQFEGTCSATNGIGSSKRELLEAELGRETVKMMRSVKASIDPANIMNPGKVFVSFEHPRI